MAALWCCRLLPFSKIFARDTKHSQMGLKLQLTALSALSEIRNSTFLANLLALCFPAPSSDDKSLNSKFQRLMARLRSAHDSSTEQPLSVIYQTKSQQVLKQRSAAFGGDSCGCFCLLVSPQELKLFEHEFGDVEISSQAFDVGCFVFEYDVDYLDFLETLLAVTLQNESYQPTTSKPMLNSSTIFSSTSLPNLEADKPALSQVPFISDHVQLIKDSNDASPSCERLVPLLHLLKEWSELPQPQQQQQKTSKNVKRNKKESRGDGGISAMRVNVSLELVINCLRQQEEEMLVLMRKEDDNRLEGVGNLDNRNRPSSPRASLVDVNVSSPSQGRGDQTLHIDELMESKRITKKTKHVLESNNVCTQSPPGAKYAANNMSAIGSFPLLKVPKGVLQVSLQVHVTLRVTTSSHG